jgi:hypothetical protein
LVFDLPPSLEKPELNLTPLDGDQELLSTLAPTLSRGSCRTYIRAINWIDRGFF